MVKIHIKDLTLFCLIGIYPEERKKKQKLIFNITINACLKEPLDDEITNTIDYADVENKVAYLIENSDFFLIETLANEVAKIILNDKRIESVIVKIDKPNALKFSKAASVEIQKNRN